MHAGIRDREGKEGMREGKQAVKEKPGSRECLKKDEEDRRK